MVLLEWKYGAPGCHDGLGSAAEKTQDWRKGLSKVAIGFSIVQSNSGLSRQARETASTSAWEANVVYSVILHSSGKGR